VVKPRNAIYVGGPLLDAPDDEIMIPCKFLKCGRKFSHSAWVRNHWHCPGCHEEDAAGITEED